MSKEKKKKKETRGRKPGKFYVNNEDIITEVRKFYEDDIFTNTLGQYILKIVDGVAHAPNFMGYSYLDDMRSDAIWRITKIITEKGCRVIDEDDIGEIMVDDEGHTLYKVDKATGEFELDKEENKIPLIQKQSNLFNYFSTIAWRAFQGRIKAEKKQHDTCERYKEKVFDEFEQEFDITHTDDSHDQFFYENN